MAIAHKSCKATYLYRRRNLWHSGVIEPMRLTCVRGRFCQKMLQFALPLMCSSILQLLFNAADVIVVGRFAGDNSLAAVGS